MAESVADFFATLGLKVDQRAWSIGDRMIVNLKQKLSEWSTYERGIKWFSGVIGGVVDLGDALDEASQKTGVSVEELQELGYAAGLSGVSQEELNGTLGKLNKNIYAASQGSKQATKAFSTMGVSVKDAHGKLRPAADVLGDISDHFATLPDGPKKTALAMQVMGRSGANLIPVLNQGRTKLEELRQEFIDTGAEIDGPTAEAFGTLNDQKDLLMTGWKGIKTQLATALLPTLIELVRGFNAWIKANRGMIRQKIEVVAKVIAASLKIVAKAILFVLDALTFLNDHWDQAKYFIYAIVAALAIYEAATIAAGIASAISWLVGLWPLGLLLLAIGAVILIIEDLYQYFTGGESVFGVFLDAVQKYIGVDMVGIVDEAVSTITTLFTVWWDTMKMIFAFVSAEFSIVKAGVELVWKVVKPIIDAIREGVGYIDDITGSVANPFGGNFGGTGTNLIQTPEGNARLQNTAAQFFGAPAAPVRTTANSSNQSAAFSANITVNAGAGADGAGIAEHIRKTVAEHWDGQMRTFWNGSGGEVD